MPAALAVLVSVLAFSPSLTNGFVNLDDDKLFVPGGLGTALGFGLGGAFQPLTALTHALDALLWGYEPAGYHFMSLLWHGLNVFLVYRLGRRLLKDDAAAALAAAAWGAHPLRVEAVAWAANRSYLVPTAFALLCADDYLAGRRGRALLWFALSLLGKAVAAPLPLALALLDRGPWRKRLSAAAPFLALSAAAVLVSAVGRAGASALLPVERFGWPQRLAQAGHGLWFYLAKTAWPSGLSPVYPVPRGLALAGLPLLGLLSAAAAGWALRRRPALASAWWSYVLLLSPFLGLLAYGQRLQLAADKWCYLASVPAALVLGRAPRRLMLAAVACWACLSARQTLYWRDSETLFRRAVSVSPDCALCRNNLGAALASQRRFDEAKAEFRLALESDPGFSVARRNLADILRYEESRR